MFVLLTTRGRVRLPAGTSLWLILLAVIALSATRLDRITQLFVFTLRYGHLLTAFIVGVYVYNLARDKVPWARIANPLMHLLASHGGARLARGAGAQVQPAQPVRARAARAGWPASGSSST